MRSSSTGKDGPFVVDPWTRRGVEGGPLLLPSWAATEGHVYSPPGGSAVTQSFEKELGRSGLRKQALSLSPFCSLT